MNQMLFPIYNQKKEKSYGYNIKHGTHLTKSLKHFSIILRNRTQSTKTVFLKLTQRNKKTPLVRNGYLIQNYSSRISLLY